MIGKFTKGFKDHVPLLLRLTLAAVFIYAGVHKLFIQGPNHVAGTMRAIGFAPGPLWAWIVIIAELGGGIFLFLGFYTRYAALAICCVMFVAIFWVHIKAGWDYPKGCQYQVTLFMMSFCVLLTGGGDVSIDSKLNQEESV